MKWVVMLIIYVKDKNARSLAHAVCMASNEDDDIGANFKSFHDRHKNCKLCGPHPEGVPSAKHNDLSLHLSILGACRQLYAEGFHMLWTTNNFTFDDPRAFKIFVSILNPAQRRKLTTITISALEAHKDALSSKLRPYQLKEWRLTYAGSETVAGLQKIKFLHLFIHTSLKYTERKGINARAFQRAFSALGALRALPHLENVTVSLSDEHLYGNSPSQLAKQQQSLPQLNALTEKFKKQLLDPAGAKMVRSETEAEKHRMRLKRIPKMESSLTYLQAMVGSASDRASYFQRNTTHLETLLARTPAGDPNEAVLSDRIARSQRKAAQAARRAQAWEEKVKRKKAKIEELKTSCVVKALRF